MATYRHAGRTFRDERTALEEVPVRVGDEITRCERDGEPFFRCYVAVAHPHGPAWPFVGTHDPCRDMYRVGTAVAS